MFKLVGAACATLLLLAAYSQRESFTKYKAVEAHEVQPGILAFPNYTEEGQVCEIGIERNHYSLEIIHLDSGLSREEIEKTVDELAPAAVRGQKWDSPLNGLMTITGQGDDDKHRIRAGHGAHPQCGDRRLQEENNC